MRQGQLDAVFGFLDQWRAETDDVDVGQRWFGCCIYRLEKCIRVLWQVTGKNGRFALAVEQLATNALAVKRGADDDGKLFAILPDRGLPGSPDRRHGQHLDIGA